MAVLAFNVTFGRIVAWNPAFDASADFGSVISHKQKHPLAEGSVRRKRNRFNSGKIKDWQRIEKEYLRTTIAHKGEDRQKFKWQKEYS